MSEEEWLLKKKEIVLFGGTTEGKLLAEYMERQGMGCYVCVATEYGRQVLPPDMKYGTVFVGRLNRLQMEKLLLEREIRLVLDATHPYALEVTRNITWACEKNGIRCIRIGREVSPEIAGAVYVSSTQEAADYLEGQRGCALITTGSKELTYFRSVTDYRNRLYARILPMEQAVKKAGEYGFAGEHLICGRGPFSVEQNLEVIAESHARFLVTKDTGAEGGFMEKAEAARQAGIRLVVIRRPVEEQGMTVEEAKSYLQKNGAGD